MQKKTSLKNASDTFRCLSPKQKIRYILDYYKGWFFLAFAALLLLFYVGDMVWQSHQIIDLQGFFINDQYNLFPAKELTEDFSAYAHTKKGHRIAFEDSLFVNLDSGSEYHAASQGKIVAYTAAKQLDFLVVPRDLAGYYARSFVLRDMETLLPQNLREALSGELIYLPDGTGSEKACLLSLKNSRFSTDIPDDGTDYCMMVMDYTGHSGSVTSFIGYAWENRE